MTWGHFSDSVDSIGRSVPSARLVSDEAKPLLDKWLYFGTFSAPNLALIGLEASKYPARKSVVERYLH